MKRADFDPAMIDDPAEREEWHALNNQLDHLREKMDACRRIKYLESSEVAKQLEAVAEREKNVLILRWFQIGRAHV